MFFNYAVFELAYLLGYLPQGLFLVLQVLQIRIITDMLSNSNAV